MPMKLVRSDSNARLWETCASRFLDEIGDATGPRGYPSHLWLSHRAQRDLLLDAAAARGLPGWLDPPFSFLSELPDRFGITRRPIGPLTGRLLVSRLATGAARAHGFVAATGAETPGRGHMVDRALSELLPEGIAPGALAESLERLGGDDFTRRRDAWLFETYRAYVERLEERDQFDPRAVHALVAERIERGGLGPALGDAARLHVYGVTSLRGRTRLFRALASSDRDVVVYLPSETEPGEWEALASGVETVAGFRRGRAPDVQPVPDAIREAEWVTRSIKRLLVEGDALPHEIAVVARSGREDTRRIHETLRRAGVPSTARLRSRLDEIPALRALLQLFAGAASEWSWEPLRAVLGSPYTGVSIDLRSLDVLASRARPRGLEGWVAGLRSLDEELDSERGWVLRRAGVTPGLLGSAIREVERFAREIDDLASPRSELEWIDATRGVLRGDRLALHDAVCRVVGDRWDVVRLDQRGVLALDGLLREWRDLVPDAGRSTTVAEWHDRLGRLLEANEVAISSPCQRGVQVLEAHEAALTPFRHAFIVHANDGVFPHRPGGGLFTEEEREGLVAEGLPLSSRDLAFERERRLWLACVGCDAVRITYRTADASGIPRLASLFVPAHDRSIELPRTRRALAGESPDAVPMTRGEVLEAELSRFRRLRRSGRRQAFATPDPEAVRAATLRAFAEELRSGGLDEEALRAGEERTSARADDGEEMDAAALFGNRRPLSQRPSAWNGELRDPAILEHLARRYAGTHEWSASQLEQYGTRPFDFLLDRVLGLREIETAEDEASRLTVGGLIHEALETFYRARIGRPSEGFETARAELEGAFAAACGAYEASESRWVGVPHVWAATREALRERLLTFVEWEFTRPRPGSPLAVELAFGHGAERPAVDLSAPEPGGGRLPLLLGGRVDRVDRVDAGDGLRVVDYKSGRSGPRPGGFDDGAALQAALYMAAVDAMGLGTAVEGTYRTVAAPADRSRRKAADVEPAVAIARRIAARVRTGLFEAVQAGSTDLKDWQPGIELSRTSARIESGTRFDPIAPLMIPGTAAARGARRGSDADGVGT